MNAPLLIFLSAVLGFFIAHSALAESPATLSAPPPSAFNVRLAGLRKQSLDPVPACSTFSELAEQKGFLKSKNADGAPLPAPSWALDMPLSKESALNLAHLLSKWPGPSTPFIQAHQIILQEKFPPAHADSKGVLDDYSALGSCFVNETWQAALKLQNEFVNLQLSPEEKAKVGDGLKVYLQNLTDKPGSMGKTQAAYQLMQFLDQQRLDAQLIKKDRQIRSLRERFKNATALAQNESLPDLWRNVHEAEKLRMELGRILFFP